MQKLRILVNGKDHRLMTDILGPTILFPSAYKLLALNPPVWVLLFILLFVFLNQFLEPNPVGAIFTGLLGIMLAVFPVVIGFLLIDVYLVWGWMLGFFYFYNVRAVDSFCCSNSFVYPFNGLFIDSLFFVAKVIYLNYTF